MDLRPLTEEEKRTLCTLETMYAQAMATLDSSKVVDHASAVMKVEGLLTRLRKTGMVSPVLSTLERVLVGDGN